MTHQINSCLNPPNLNIQDMCKQTGQNHYELNTQDISSIEKILTYWQNNLWQNDSQVQYYGNSIIYKSTTYSVSNIELWYQGGSTIKPHICTKVFFLAIDFTEKDGSKKSIYSQINFQYKNEREKVRETCKIFNVEDASDNEAGACESV